MVITKGVTALTQCFITKLWTYFTNPKKTFIQSVVFNKNKVIYKLVKKSSSPILGRAKQKPCNVTPANSVDQ